MHIVLCVWRHAVAEHARTKLCTLATLETHGANALWGWPSVILAHKIVVSTSEEMGVCGAAYGEAAV